MACEKITVITICFNAEQHIAGTVESVLSQDYPFFEYIVVDGSSADRTLEIVNSYRPDFEKKNIPFLVQSEPDKGIYDAMNKGIRLAAGDRIIYMNSGDRFLDGSSLSRVFGSRKYEADVVYGDTVVQNGSYWQKRACLPVEMLESQMPFIHQSVFVKTSVMKAHPFNTEYRVAADYDLFVRLYTGGHSFEHVDTIVSVFDLTGVSETNQDRARTEDCLIRRRNGISSDTDPGRVVLRNRLALARRRLILSLMPSVYYSTRRGWYPSLEQLLEQESK